jgi:hypothetical protein
MHLRPPCASPRLLAALLTGLALAAPARACPVPVFRTALEGSREWKHFPLDLVVFHHGPLTDPQRRWLDAIDDLSWKNGGGLNLELETADVSGEIPEGLRKLWKAHEKEALPLAVLRHARPTDDMPASWTGPLTAEAARTLTESPARREVARRVLSGQSAVYLLLESGDKAADDRAERLLAERLRQAEKDVKLSLDVVLPLLRSKLPLRVQFSTLRVRRDDPAEAALIALLLQTDSDLPKEAGPIAFACFGRGRVHLPLYGRYLTAEEIDRGLDYLTGETGHDNPGHDLLFHVDWEAGLEAAGPVQPLGDPFADLKGPDLPAPPQAKPAHAAPAHTEGGDGRLWRNLIYTGVGLLLLILCAAVVLAARSKRGAA